MTWSKQDMILTDEVEELKSKLKAAYILAIGFFIMSVVLGYCLADTTASASRAYEQLNLDMQLNHSLHQQTILELRRCVAESGVKQ